MAYVFSSLTYTRSVWLEEYPKQGYKQIQLMNKNILLEYLTEQEKLYVESSEILFLNEIINYDNYINYLKQFIILYPNDNQTALFLVLILFVKTQPEIRGYLN